MTRRAPEPIVPVRQMFPRRVFATGPGIHLTWEALGSGLQALDARADALPANGARRHRAAPPVQLALEVQA